MPLISIIIPIYNCEKYLARCLDSVTNQTLKELEIICINDGSTDNSLNILNQYANTDSRINVISQENRKQGAARNKGLEIARGKYITFVDSDDWIDLDYCEKLYNSAEECNVNIAAASMVREKINKKRNHLKLSSKNVFFGANDIITAIDEHLETAGKLYKFECIKNLRFIEEILYEDAPYTIRAIDQCNSLVTVPDTTYHYFSNPKSTIKSKQDEKRRNDIIETQLDLLKYAKDNNIILSNNFVVKDEKFLFKVKNYTDRREYYFCGIKFHTKYIPFNNEKIFVILILACFTDVLLCNSLVQNIKNLFPNSKVVFIVDKPYEEVAKNQKGTDEVYVFDKKGKHNSILGILKFAKNFPYKHMDYLIKIHSTERIEILTHFLKPKNIPHSTSSYVSVQERNTKVLESITHKTLHNYPLTYFESIILSEEKKNIFKTNEKYIALCTISSQEPKNMPIDTAVGLINKLNSQNYNVIFLGKGDNADKYAQCLIEKKCNFVNLANKTTIPELASIIKKCNALISVDTGTMHFGYSLSVPTVCVFYLKENISMWAPTEKLYNVKVLDNNQTVENIYEQLEALNAK